MPKHTTRAEFAAILDADIEHLQQMDGVAQWRAWGNPDDPTLGRYLHLFGYLPGCGDCASTIEHASYRTFNERVVFAQLSPAPVRLPDLQDGGEEISRVKSRKFTTAELKEFKRRQLIAHYGPA